MSDVWDSAAPARGSDLSHDVAPLQYFTTALRAPFPMARSRGQGQQVTFGASLLGNAWGEVGPAAWELRPHVCCYWALPCWGGPGSTGSCGPACAAVGPLTVPVQGEVRARLLCRSYMQG
jgi:hypothetical protein